MNSSPLRVFIDICQRMLIVPVTLLSTLFFSEVFYSSVAARRLTFCVITIETIFVYQSHEITNIVVLFVIGFSAAIYLFWAANMLLFGGSLQHLRRLQKIQVQGKDSHSLQKYVWQQYPVKMSWERLAWVFDLMINPRGIGWSFCKPYYPLPREVQKLYADIGINVSSKTTTRTNTLSRSAFLQEHYVRLIVLYLLTDLCLNIMDFIPFFQASKPVLDWVLPVSLQNVLFFPSSILAGFAVFAGLDLFATFIGILNVGVFGPKCMGTWGEPFLYPRLFGSVYAIWDDGLIGFWSIMWHDFFKRVFQDFSRGLIPEPPNSDRSSRAYKIRAFLRLNIVFCVSGACHAAASYIEAAHTYPVLTFIAFASQGVGIGFQQVLVVFLQRCNASELQRKMAVATFGTVWMYFTIYLFLGDLAASGIFEVKFPVSVVGLCLGRRWLWFQ